ncbi:MAG: DUF3140 domain-containing protein [Hyphomicrobiales bacterium]|nr:DUF3140 domain-containing protein [Hyphomicrobiales bacterium]
MAEIKRSRDGNLSDDDYRHMSKVVASIKTHSAAQRPNGDITSTRWRYSLMNWGHDPLKD